MKRIRKLSLADWIFAVIILLYIVYAARFIQQTSFFLQGERYYVLFDDAMISMRFAKNLAEGNGLVWNPGGERIEGYTNPLWVIYMSLFHLLPVSNSKVSLFVQISGVIFLIANLFFVRKIAREVSGNETAALTAVFLTAFFFSLNNWAIQGMEVGIVTLLSTFTVWHAIQALRAGKVPIGLFFLIGAGTLIRIDVTVLYLTVLGVLVLVDGKNRTQHLVWGILVLGIFLGGQTAARYVYYGELLPNTYNLKIEGIPMEIRVSRGLQVLQQFLWTTNWALFVIPLFLLAFRWDREFLLLYGVVLVQIAYSVYVGGDAWEQRGGANRFISQAMPVFFILFSYSLEMARGAFLHKLNLKNKPALAISKIFLLAFVTMSLFSFNVILTNDANKKWLLMETPIFVDGTKYYTEIGLTVQEVTTEEATIAVVTAGAIPYFADREAIDLLGKIDKVIAHSPPKVTEGDKRHIEYRPGHNKWDYSYSIGELHPDVVVQLLSGTSDEAAPYLEQFYVPARFENFTMYFKIGSPHVIWERI